MENLYQEILKAKERLSSVIEKTPLLLSNPLSTQSQKVYLKLENLQKTDSFKIRGSYNKIASLPESIREKGIICSSACNHAQGVSLSAKLFNIPSIICMPLTALQTKIDNTKNFGATVILHGKVYDESADKGKELQKEKGYTYIHPFDDDLIIVGQGTIGLEIINDNSNIDTIVVPIRGGGLISGIAIAAKSINKDIEVIGVQSEGSPSMVESIKKGEKLTVNANTVADVFKLNNLDKKLLNILKNMLMNVLL